MDELQIQSLKWLTVAVFACGTLVCIVGSLFISAVLAETGVGYVSRAYLAAKKLPNTAIRIIDVRDENEMLRRRVGELTFLLREARPYVQRDHDSWDRPSCGNAEGLLAEIDAAMNWRRPNA